MPPAKFQNLLTFLGNHPEVVRDIVFDPVNLQTALAADPQVPPTKTFLDYLSQPADGHPIANCGGNTRYMCAKGTKMQLLP
jgi:hypothetical protein